MKVRIEHQTAYTYAQPASASFNEVRLVPRNNDTQNLLDSQIFTEPTAKTVSFRDHFGTLVHVFDVWPPHDRLVVTGVSTVVTYPRLQPFVGAGLLTALDDPLLRDSEAEWLHNSPLASGGDHLSTFAQHVRQVVKPASVSDLVLGVNHEVNGRFSYSPGSSYVSSTVDDLLERGTGVCQDFAHLMIATLRDLGVPARYVSGYFYAGPPGEIELDSPLQVESHAWVEAFVPGFGWWEVDPTNDTVADERHVTVAVGRDYSDVAPMRGVHRGGDGAHMEVNVMMIAPSQDEPGLMQPLPPVPGPAAALASVVAPIAIPGSPGTGGNAYVMSPDHQRSLVEAQQQQQQ